MPAHEGAGKTGKTTLVFQPDASVNGWREERSVDIMGFLPYGSRNRMPGGQVVKQTEKQGNIALDP